MAIHIMRNLMLVLLLLTSFDVYAAVFCVTSGQNLSSVIEIAQNNEVHDEIRIPVGTYTNNWEAPGAPQWQVFVFGLEDMDKQLTISGGWSTGDNCTSQVSLNPAATVLDAQNTGPVFSIYFNVPGFLGTFTLQNLTLNRGKAFVQGQATGLHLSGTTMNPASIVLDNLHIVNGQSALSSSSALFVGMGAGGNFRLRNSIVSFNSFSGSGSIPVVLWPSASGVGFISNNSVFGNSSTSTSAGLSVIGIATISNNAIAENSSTANPSYQFFSGAPTGLTLVKNHFGTEGWVNGAPFSETGTTTGNAFWAPLGVERIPLEASPLRDSGNNTPTGGALPIDFNGRSRVINTTIDRGASEAPAPSTPAEGPIVTDNTPVKGSTTWLYGESGQSALGEITFSVSGGAVGGLTLIECQVTSGTVLFGAYDTQYVATGQSAQPVLIGFDNLSETVQTGVVLCTFKRSGVVGQTFAAYTFKGGLGTVFKDGFE